MNMVDKQDVLICLFYSQMLWATIPGWCQKKPQETQLAAKVSTT